MTIAVDWDIKPQTKQILYKKDAMLIWVKKIKFCDYISHKNTTFVLISTHTLTSANSSFLNCEYCNKV